MKRLMKTLLAGAAALCAAGAAMADITIGVTLPLTGPASGLGLPMQNQFKLWPATLAGEKVNLVILDDATDPTKGVQNAKRFVTQDNVDVIIGSAATPVAIPIADVATESGTVQLAASPAALPPGKDAWTFRLPQSTAVMANGMITHMVRNGVKTVGFLGYSDAYGEAWLKDFGTLAEKTKIKMSDVERFARSDTAVTAQALKLVQANPDAILVVASGSGAAMPAKALVERGYKGKIYETHAAATRDLMRVGGKDVEGVLVVSGPAVIAEQLPDSHPSKARAVDFVQKYEKAYGPGSRNQFAAHAYDAYLLLEKAVPVAMKTAKPGTKEFRLALRDALESMGQQVVSHGVINWTKEDHWGFTNKTPVMLKVVNGDWKIE
jgi:branched-chain amino acid transport system substrate-binding protein